jgi:hypothetical protein
MQKAGRLAFGVQRVARFLKKRFSRLPLNAKRSTQD